MHREFVKDFVQQHFNLGEVIKMEPFFGGLQNYTAKVETEEGVFTVKLFTKGRERLSRIKSTLLLLERLSVKGLRVHSVVRTKNEKLFVPIRNSEFHQVGAVLSYLGGKILPPEEIDLSLIVEASRYLGVMHEAFESVRTHDLKFSHSPKIRDKVKELAETIPQRLKENYLQFPADEVNWISDCWRYSEQFLSEIQEVELRNNELIHTDYSRVNLLFRGDRLTGVLDFDTCRFGDYREDLAISSWMWYEYQRRGYSFSKVRQKVVLGYTEVRQSTERDLELINGIALLTAWDKLNWYIEEPRNEGEVHYHREAYESLREPLGGALSELGVIT